VVVSTVLAGRGGGGAVVYIKRASRGAGQIRVCRSNGWFWAARTQMHGRSCTDGASGLVISLAQAATLFTQFSRYAALELPICSSSSEIAVRH